MLKLVLDNSLVDRARDAAAKITGDLKWLFESQSSVTIERTVLRLMGIDGATEDGKPLPNVVIDHLQEKSALFSGAAIRIGNAMINHDLTAQEVAEKSSCGRARSLNSSRCRSANFMTCWVNSAMKCLPHQISKRK